MAFKKELGQDVLCPICGKYIFEFDFDICEVCKWENDPLQNENHDYAGGANKMSVNEAREVYKQAKKAE